MTGKLVIIGVGMASGRVIADPETRAALVARYELSRSIHRHAPWAGPVRERAQSYTPIAALTLKAAE